MIIAQSSVAVVRTDVPDDDGLTVEITCSSVASIVVADIAGDRSRHVTNPTLDSTWNISPNKLDALLNTLHHMGFLVFVQDAATTPALPTPSWLHGAFSSCSTEEQITALRKALMRVHHPDLDGSAEQATQINAHAEARRKEIR